ncbi:MAG: VCBS repeat-containing protein [Gemmatimonadaceae bacterium]
MNGDHLLDLVVIDERTGPAIFYGRPDMTFGPPVPLGDAKAVPYAMEVADLDQNGTPDIILGFVESRPIVYFNDGGDTFTPVVFGDDEGTAYGFAVGDLNEDGLLDIAMARSDARNMLYFGSGIARKLPGVDRQRVESLIRSYQ